MFEWDAPSSPTGRGVYHPQQWPAIFPTSPMPIPQAAFTHLQPSTSIWGPQIQKPPVNAFTHLEEAAHPLNYTAARVNHGCWPERQRRLSSVPSLTSNWGEDNYLVSPPSSPESCAAASNPPSPQPISISKGSEPLNDVDGDEVEEITISSFCGPLYLVQFKGGRVDIFMAPGTSYYTPGDSVMVDADRGSDLGKVMQANVSRHDAICFKQKQNKERSRALSASHITGNDHHQEHSVFVPKQIIGRATQSNIRDMAAKCRDEAAAVSVCNAKVAERGLNIDIVDAEYQWDRRKLTFFYNAGTRVDFRDLVRDLFRVYKTRIWMCATTAR